MVKGIERFNALLKTESFGYAKQFEHACVEGLNSL